MPTLVLNQLVLLQRLTSKVTNLELHTKQLQKSLRLLTLRELIPLEMQEVFYSRLLTLESPMYLERH